MPQAPGPLPLRTGAETFVAGLFADDCVSVEAAPALVDAALFPEERAFIVNAVPKRRAEFGSARMCARHALEQLGTPAGALLPAADRAPTWPAGTVGSITHTHGYCGVVVARAARYASLGLDAERDKELSPEIIRMVCTPAERANIAAPDAILYFAAKEAFYKCQYPLTRQFLDFQDVELTLDPTLSRFDARVLRVLTDKPRWLDRLHGRILRRDGLVLCAVSLETAALTAR
jgi:4'-phosphopantetheinyl transferase EntD